MKILKKPAFWVISLLVSGLLIGILNRLDSLDDLRNQENQKSASVGVYTAPAKKDGISKWVVGEGTALAVRKRHLIFETSGKVVFIAGDKDGAPIREGSRIQGPSHGEKFGQLLARLDKRGQTARVIQSEAGLSEARQNVSAAKAALAQTQTTLTVAQSSFERSKILHQKKLISVSRFEQDNATFESAKSMVKNAKAELGAARSRIKSMQAALNQAKIEMENTAIFAPFDGIIARLNISEGGFFSPAIIDNSNSAAILDTAPITVVDPGELEITLNLPVFDGMHVKEGQNAVVTWGGIDWLGGEWEKEDPVIFGRVYSVSPVLNIGGRTVRIKVRLKQKEALIPHGMFVTCWIEVNKKTDALLVPITSLLYRDDKPYVYVIVNDKAIKRPIQIGLTDEEAVEVIKGLTENEQVVTKGKYRLHEGTHVRILVKEEEPKDES